MRWQTDARRCAPFGHAADRIRTTGVLLAIVLLELFLAQTALSRITHATRLTGALVAILILPANGILAAGILSTAVLLHRLALVTRIAEEAGSAAALRLPVHNATLRVQTARTRAQARIDALSARALLVQLAVVVGLAFVLLTAYRRITLETVGAQAKRTMVRHLAERILAARSTTGTRIHTLAVGAGPLAGAVGVRSTARHTGPILTE